MAALEPNADPFDAVVDLNGVRRQMTPAQRALVAARISSDSGHGGARKNEAYENQSANLHFDFHRYTQDLAAKALGVSRRNVIEGRKTLKFGEDDVIADIDAGKLGIAKATVRTEERQAAAADAKDARERAEAARAAAATAYGRERADADDS